MTPLSQLRKLIRQHGSPAKAAAAIGVSRQYVNAVTSGKVKSPTLLARKLGMKLEWVKK